MKMPPLPEIDLARIAVLPPEQRRRALQQMKMGRPPYSYAPTRKLLPDIYNVEIGSLGKADRTSWPTISGLIAREARTLDENDANQHVAKSLYDFSVDRNLRGRQHDFMPISIGLAAKVSYWSNAVLSLDGRPTVPFIDPRRAKTLTSEARRFVFSVMHERIRAADEDLADVNFVIFQFGKIEDDTSRPIRHFLDERSKLFTFDEIDLMVRETYQMWRDVLEERERDTRKKAASGGGLF